LEYALFKPFGAIDTPMELAGFLIALITCVCSIILCLISIIWWWALRKSKITDLGGWFLGTAFVMLGICYWTLTGMAQITLFDMVLPNISFPARFVIMLGCLFKVWKATKCKPMPHMELSRLAGTPTLP
jgi:hypothetical protein